MLLICCYLSHQPARCLQFSCFCSLLTPVKHPVRGFQRYPQLALRATVQQDRVAANLSLWEHLSAGARVLCFPAFYLYQRRQRSAVFGCNFNFTEWRQLQGLCSHVILMSKHPGGVLPPLLASCLSPHRSVLPSGGSPEMLCLPAGHPFKVSGSSGNLTLEEPHFQLLTHFTFIQTFTTIPPTG